jgi:glycosyltransferase involved in cell wall biosynthesis
MWVGQRDLLAVPQADVAVYMHQIRPLRPGASVTVVHDTIWLRHGGSRTARLVKRVLLRAAARVSTEILTASEFSRTCIVRDLGVSSDRISVMRFPVDADRATAIARARTALPQEERLLYIGRFIPHKNLHRLCLAFARSGFARRGGRLLLVGGWDGEVDAMRAWVASTGIAGVEARPACSEEELDRLLATSRALVLPSLEEGYGLPAFEAVASGLPVAASRTGALTELPAERAVLFDPSDVAGMGSAIDDATSRPPTGFATIAQSTLREVVIATTARALEHA